jgi:hypothetical protein
MRQAEGSAHASMSAMWERNFGNASVRIDFTSDARAIRKLSSNVVSGAQNSI